MAVYDLTILYAVIGRRYEKMAELSAASARRHNPRVFTRIEKVHVNPKLERFRFLRGVKRPWVLFMDADTVFQDDPMKLIEPLEAGGFEFGTRQPPFQGGSPHWHEDRYRQMLVDMKLPYRRVACSGLWAGTKRVARNLAGANVRSWAAWYLDYRPKCWTKRTRKYEVMGLTLALASQGITDERTYYYDGTEMALEGLDGPGVVRHFGTALLRPYRTSKALTRFYATFNSHSGDGVPQAAPD